MNLHSLKGAPGARRRPVTVGRGTSAGRGKTCGRGHKGQMARPGHKHKLGFEGGQIPLLRRIPKRGFVNTAYGRCYVVVNVGTLAGFEDGAEVTPDVLKKVGLAGQARDGVKILGGGELGRKLTVKAQAFSASARRKIEAAGGTCQVL